MYVCVLTACAVRVIAESDMMQEFLATSEDEMVWNIE